MGLYGIEFAHQVRVDREDNVSPSTPAPERQLPRRAIRQERALSRTVRRRERGSGPRSAQHTPFDYGRRTRQNLRGRLRQPTHCRSEQRSDSQDHVHELAITVLFRDVRVELANWRVQKITLRAAN